jgi:hypothetical protein
MLGSTDDTFTWEVEAYSTLGPSRKRSGSFLYRDLKWSLLLDPKGDDKSGRRIFLCPFSSFVTIVAMVVNTMCCVSQL